MRKLLYTATIMTLLTACEKEIDFSYNEVEPVVTIEGRVTNEGTEVLITKSRSVTDPTKGRGLHGAEVAVTCEGAEERLTYDEATGYYRSPLKGQPGQTYHLTVDFEGRHYEATSYMCPPATFLSAEFLWQPINNERMLAYELWAVDPEPDVRNYYWFRMDRISHHPHFENKTSTDAYRTYVFNDRGCPPGRIYRDVMCMTEQMAEDDEKDDWEDILYEGDSITMRIMVVDEPTYDFLRSLSMGQRNGANPISNIKGDPCLGYFTAASVTYADTLVFRYDDIRTSE